MVEFEPLIEPNAVLGFGTLFSLSIFLVFVNEIGVPALPDAAYAFATLLYIGGLLTGYGFSHGRPDR